MSKPPIEVVSVEASPTAVLKGHATIDELPMVIGRLLDPVWAYLRTSELVTNHNVVLYLGDVMSAHGADVEVGVQVDRPFDGVSAEGVRSSALPAARVARGVHVGPYNRVGDTHAAVIAYCEEHGLTRSGVSWEVYGDWDDDPTALQTEVAHVLT